MDKKRDLIKYLQNSRTNCAIFFSHYFSFTLKIPSELTIFLKKRKKRKKRKKKGTVLETKKISETTFGRHDINKKGWRCRTRLYKANKTLDEQRKPDEFRCLAFKILILLILDLIFFFILVDWLLDVNTGFRTAGFRFLFLPALFNLLTCIFLLFQLLLLLFSCISFKYSCIFF